MVNQLPELVSGFTLPGSDLLEDVIRRTLSFATQLDHQAVDFRHDGLLGGTFELKESLLDSARHFASVQMVEESSLWHMVACYH